MIHPTALVHESVHVPESSAVWAFCNIGMGVVIEENVSIGAHTEIGNYSRIGEGTRIGRGVFLPHKSQVGRWVFIGPNATFADDKHPSVNKGLYRPQPPTIEDHARVGAGADILAGVTIGEGAMVGMGSVVTKDVPPYKTVKGNPAR
jgi:acetyltransferase-like isoleucine patch superfamily enzyme